MNKMNTKILALILAGIFVISLSAVVLATPSEWKDYKVRDKAYLENAKLTGESYWCYGIMDPKIEAKCYRQIEKAE